MIRRGTLSFAIAGLATAGLAAPSAGAERSKVPPDVAKAAKSVVRIERFAAADKKPERSAAFAIDTRGTLLTTTSAAARATDRKLFRGASKTALRADDLPNDAPPGLTLIRLTSGTPPLRPLRRASRFPANGRVWIVAPRGVLERPLATTITPGVVNCSDDRGIKTVLAASTDRTNGSPVLNSSGRYVGVVRVNPPDGQSCKRMQFVPALAPIAQLPPVPAAKRADFPAVAVVIAIGILLLVANVVFYFRRRRRVEDPVSDKPEAVLHTPVAPPPPEHLDEDEVQVTLRPRDGARRSDTPVARSGASHPRPTRVARPRDTVVSSDPAPDDDPDDDVGPVTLR